MAGCTKSWSWTGNKDLKKRSLYHPHIIHKKIIWFDLIWDFCHFLVKIYTVTNIQYSQIPSYVKVLIKNSRLSLSYHNPSSRPRLVLISISTESIFIQNTDLRTFGNCKAIFKFSGPQNNYSFYSPLSWPKKRSSASCWARKQHWINMLIFLHLSKSFLQITLPERFFFSWKFTKKCFKTKCHQMQYNREFYIKV